MSFHNKTCIRSAMESMMVGCGSRICLVKLGDSSFSQAEGAEGEQSKVCCLCCPELKPADHSSPGCKHRNPSSMSCFHAAANFSLTCRRCHATRENPCNLWRHILTKSQGFQPLQGTWPCNIHEVVDPDTGGGGQGREEEAGRGAHVCIQSSATVLEGAPTIQPCAVQECAVCRPNQKERT